MDSITKIRINQTEMQNEFTIHSILNVLKDLETIAFQMLDEIHERISLNEKRTNVLLQKISSASLIIEQISGSNNVVQVISLAKYPVEDNQFYGIDFLNSVICEALQTKPVANRTIIDKRKKLLYFKRKRKSKRRRLHIMIKQARNISDILNFNSSKSVFYTKKKKLSKVKRQSRKVIADAKTSSATLSIFNRKIVEKGDDEKYTYFPKVEKVPDLETPQDLPDLVGVAGDLQFASPSAEKLADETHDLPQSTDTGLKMIDESNVLPNVTPLNVSEPPLGLPPPPPPPMPPQSGQNLPKIESEPKTPVKPDKSEDARSNLMASIRQAAGKAKLRAASAIAGEEKVFNKQSPGNLMEDLHAKLSMRRKGISGGPKALDGQSMLDKLSSIIPEPEADSESSSDDNGWE